MAHIYARVFTSAPDKDTAICRVESWLEDCSEREFFDGAEVLEDDVVLASSLSPVYFAKGRKETDGALRRRREDAVRSAERGDKSGEGRALIHAGNILCESLCYDMPWFNMEYWDWTVPDDASREQGKDWYAVMVNFHC
jgi:hypothetical protein